jgi:hypothetical protein
MRYLILLLLLSSCRIALPTIGSTVTSSDSVSTQVLTRYRDTMIYVKPDSVILYDHLPCPDLNYFNGVTDGRLTATVKIENGIMKVDCKADSLELRIQQLETEITTQKTAIRETTTERIKEVVKYRYYGFRQWLIVLLLCVFFSFYGKGFFTNVYTFIKNMLR